MEESPNSFVRLLGEQFVKRVHDILLTDQKFKAFMRKQSGGQTVTINVDEFSITFYEEGEPAENSPEDPVGPVVEQVSSLAEHDNVCQDLANQLLDEGFGKVTIQPFSIEYYPDSETMAFNRTLMN